VYDAAVPGHKSKRLLGAQKRATHIDRHYFVPRCNVSIGYSLADCYTGIVNQNVNASEFVGDELNGPANFFL
jgi:hypothetical protein